MIFPNFDPKYENEQRVVTNIVILMNVKLILKSNTTYLD